jgi:hypothetical protein
LGCVLASDESVAAKTGRKAQRIQITQIRGIQILRCKYQGEPFVGCPALTIV